MYQHILVAIDLSPASDWVLKQASAIAEYNHAKLSLVHVMEHSPLVYGGEFSISINPDLQQEFEHAAREGLADLGEKYHIQPEDQHIRQGSVKQVVKDLVEQLNIDLIVIGSHSKKEMGFLLGSIANAILHVATCDVFVVKINKPE